MIVPKGKYTYNVEIWMGDTDITWRGKNNKNKNYRLHNKRFELTGNQLEVFICLNLENGTVK